MTKWSHRFVSCAYMLGPKMSTLPLPVERDAVAVAATTPLASPPSSNSSRSPRLQSLDAYRGLIMVTLAFHGFGLAGTATNYLKQAPDSRWWNAVYHQFEHAEWIG